MKVSVFIIFLFSIYIISCSEDSPTSSSDEDLVEVQFDLQTGFDNVSLSIMEDDRYYFNAMFTGIELLTGPQASFTTFLPAGEHTFIIRRTQLDNFTNFKIDTCMFNIGKADKYWIGIGVNSDSDSLFYIVQDFSFFYI